MILILLCIAQGLPVLTIDGNSFPSRVATSLYASFGDMRFPQLLVVSSMKEFVDTAKRLLSHDRYNDYFTKVDSTSRLTERHLLQSLKDELLDAIDNKMGLFNTTQAVSDFVHAGMSLVEARESGAARRLPRKHRVSLCLGRAACSHPSPNSSNSSRPTDVFLPSPTVSLPHVCVTPRR